MAAMDLIDRLREISARIPKLREHLKTEEATKNALVLPFISALGYDIFDPTEVNPEFVADVGTKKGEKVDYAILSGDCPIPLMLIECKFVDANLDNEDPTQLYRYFAAAHTRLAVLTNGINYRFYSDLEDANVMDKKPFFEFNMTNVTEEVAAEIKKFTKEKFNLGDILSTAAELKYTKGIKGELAALLEDPSENSEFSEDSGFSEDIGKLLATRLYSGNRTRSVIDQFKSLTRRAFQEFIDEKVNETLEKAKVRPQQESATTTAADASTPVVTTVGDDKSSLTD